MTTDARTAAVAFMNLFPGPQERGTGDVEYNVECDHDTIYHHLNFAEKLFPAHALMACPRSHPAFKYISANSAHILGHPHHALMDMELPQFFSLIHPGDLPAVRLSLDFIGDCKPCDPAAHRFVTQYRLRDSEGKYRHMREEKIAIRTRHNTFLYFMLFTNISDEEKFHQVKLDVLRDVKGAYVKVYAYNPRQQDKIITPRQNDIAQLIAKGFSNQEIADQLSVSIFTVKNHKRMLFRKVNVKNSVELANYVRGEGGEG
jgi:DNA-binding CsgD family transcriptional regulator